MMNDMIWKIAAGLMITLFGGKIFIVDPVNEIVKFVGVSKYIDASVASMLLMMVPDEQEVDGSDREESVDLEDDWTNPVIMARVLDYEDSQQSYIEPFIRGNHPWNFGPDGLPC